MTVVLDIKYIKGLVVFNQKGLKHCTCNDIFLIEIFLIEIFLIEIQLIYNVVLDSAVQQNESVVNVHISTLFQIHFPYGSLQSIEQSSLCSTVGPYQLSVLYIVQFCSVAQLCPTLCDPMNHSTPDHPVHHQLPEFTQTHVHQVDDAIQPSHLLSSPSPPAPNPSQHQGLFQFICSSVYILIPIYQFILPHLPAVTISLFSTSLTLSVLQISSFVPSFQIPHLSHIIFYLSLPDLLHLV